MPSPNMAPEAAEVMNFFRNAMDPILRASANPVTGQPSAPTTELNSLLIQLQTLPFALVRMFCWMFDLYCLQRAIAPRTSPAAALFLPPSLI